MHEVHFTANLKPIFKQSEVRLGGSTLLEVIRGLDQFQKGLSHYFLEDNDHLRVHVNLFVNGDMWDDPENLNHPIPSSSTIHVMQALSGG